MITVIDNYDSFTYNLVQFLGELGADLRVFRNDKVTVEALAALSPQAIVISPGPGSPEKDSGVSNDVLRAFSGRVPILGVCLGQQCMGHGGGKVKAGRHLKFAKDTPLMNLYLALFDRMGCGTKTFGDSTGVLPI